MSVTEHHRVNEQDKAIAGDLRAYAVWHIQEAVPQCRLGAGCVNAKPEGPCCGAIAWMDIQQHGHIMVLPGKRKDGKRPEAA